MSNTEEIQKKSKSAAKWSMLTEIAVKLVSPITQMVLARLLAPEAFGMVATVAMVVNFADLFSDAGFKKYLVQHEFASREKLYRYSDVAFWTNLLVSLALWGLIIVFDEQIAAFVGSPSLGFPLAVACASLPLTSFVSIQMAHYHRGFDFKSLLPVRIGVAVVNLILTSVLALFGFGYWALICGTIVSNAINAVALTIKSSWKPSFYYSFDKLKAMFSFSGWTMVESVVVWLSVWSGTFIVGNILGATELGLYKTPVTFVSGCFAIVSNATTPILFSALSRLQSNSDEYLRYFYSFQKIIAVILLPLSVGLFLYREPLTLLFLGPQWLDASLMFGLYGALQGSMILFSYYCSEMYRSKGKPRISTLVQIVFLVGSVPIMIIAANNGYRMVVFADAVTRLLLIVINQVVCHFVIGTSFFSMLKGMRILIFASAVMACFSIVLTVLFGESVVVVSIGIIGCIAVYFSVLFAFDETRRLLIRFLHEVKPNQSNA